jgi:hypothetical protein
MLAYIMSKVILWVEHSRPFVESILRSQIESEDFKGLERFGFAGAYHGVLFLLAHGAGSVAHHPTQPGEAHSADSTMIA